MQTRVFLALLIGLLILWVGAAIFTMLCTTDLGPLGFWRERWFGALVHSLFFVAVGLTLFAGRGHFRKRRLAVMGSFSIFLLLIYFLGLWPSMLAAFVRAPWAKEDETGPTMSAPSDYAWYAWEWEMGPGLGEN